jgi:hypothetical protein
MHDESLTTQTYYKSNDNDLSCTQCNNQYSGLLNNAVVYSYYSCSQTLKKL